MKGKELRIASLLVLDTVFFLIELTIGYMSHSLALIADSFHMLNDIISLLVAFWAVKVAKERSPTAKYTYGWKRAEILGALINAVFLIALCFSIMIQALQRLIEPEEIRNPRLVLYVGFAGLLSNCVGLFLFNDHADHSTHNHGDLEANNSSPAASNGEALSDTSSTQINSDSPSEDTFPVTERTVGMLTSENTALVSKKAAAKQKRQRSLNMHGVFLHVLGDALGNIGVIIAALIIWKTDYSWRFYSDPVVSLVITAIIFSSALPLSRKSSRILLQATPSNINADGICKKIKSIPGVVGVHDLHIWNLTESICIASVHVKISAENQQSIDTAKAIRHVFHENGVHSATVQPEFVTDSVNDHERRRFSQIAGGMDSSSSDALTRPALANTAYGSTSNSNCLIDSSVNCDQDRCLHK
ncbi:Zn(2+) transporter ZRC1 KNAG_0J00620 [Huiozyma naganishii CBS 8797]|uniref:Cation efflux protein cytoplasmic domain-containing protein n=1 Tax=Huiozyma naganishii (strain ATCC MYA-139 / BCRC 22969 / CBS 8797 / KCTC 17520 / NBRC 10181 / NCYC 3082 / Yp74L-3) TaxID=1071383 RepID=J7RB93_HUIN7|nr:hypothetical protein KNAG_0J00620 [Kazachstania naganishii CBS 8797]CCK72145.1 hypothetical protein KNAG_0J00620 [Kazachstania naganishii CBS 8797]